VRRRARTPGGTAPRDRRILTLGEEVANSVSHGIGAAGAVAITPLLILSASRRGDAADIAAASIFGAALILLYLASTLYHALPGATVKRVLRAIDHGAIFLLIAGTYTPFTLGVLRGPWGWTLFGLIWGLALLGLILNGIGLMRHAWLSTSLYVLMGWLVVIAARPLIAAVPRAGLEWLAAGGLAYTAGVAFYAARRVRYTHFVWHLCVLAGSACHVVAVWGYAT
jgi:hemolysin III